MFKKPRHAPAASAVRISSPLAHADRFYTGPFREIDRCDLWTPWACRRTTRDFGEVAGVRYFNNCGPTAVTNLMCMARARFQGQATPLPEAVELYGRTARYGVRHLFFINSSHPLFHGSSDLRAGSWLRRMCRRFLHLRLRLRLHLLREKPALRALDRGSLLYLMLWNHPVYKTHHLLACGYVRLRSDATGEEKTYLQLCDGHTDAPRYLELNGARGAFYEVRFKGQSGMRN